MLRVFLDTSTNDLLLAVSKDEEVRTYDYSKATLRVSEGCLVAIKELLDSFDLTFKDIDEFYVTRGPGSYTGERIGLTIAKTLSVLNKNLKVYTTSTLEAMCFDSTDVTSVALLDAKNNAYFYGKYLDNKALEEEARKEHVDVESSLADVKVINLLKSQENLKERFLDREVKLVDLVSNMVNHRELFELSDDPYTLKPKYLRGKDVRN